MIKSSASRRDSENPGPAGGVGGGAPPETGAGPAEADDIIVQIGRTVS